MSAQKYIGETSLFSTPKKNLTFTLKPGSVNTSKIADHAVTSDKLAPEILRLLKSRDFLLATDEDIDNLFI